MSDKQKKDELPLGSVTAEEAVKNATIAALENRVKELEGENENAYKLANTWLKVSEKIGNDLLLLQKQLELMSFDKLRLDFISQHSKDGTAYHWTENFTHVVTGDGEELRDSIDAAKQIYDKDQKK